MMVLGPGYLFRALFYFLKFPLIVFVECFQSTESQNPVVVSVEYFQSEYFPAQIFFSFKSIFLNMITVHFRLAHYLYHNFFNTMARREPVTVKAPPPYRSIFPLLCRGQRQSLVYPMRWQTRSQNPWTLEFCWIRNSQSSSVCSDQDQWQLHRGYISHWFFSVKGRRVALLGQRSVNGSVE